MTCVGNESNDKNTDPYTQQLGRLILAEGHHVYTIPRDHLATGSYALTVTITAGIATTACCVP